MTADLTTASFSVSFELVVSTTPPIVLDNIGEGGPSHTLRVDWDIRKVIGSPADVARISIYNLHPKTRVGIEGARVTGIHYPPETVARIQLAIGWGGVPQVVFAGELTQFNASRESGADIITDLEAVTGGASWQTPGSSGSEFGTAIGTILLAEAAKMGHVVTPGVVAFVEQEAAAKAISAWKRPAGLAPATILDYIFGTLDLTWGVSSKTGAIAVYKNGVRNDLPVVGLAPTSGLLNYSYSDDGFDFEALAQPDVEPGCRLQLFERGQFGVTERPVGQPVRCESVEFSGSSHGQSLMRGVARKIDLVT